MVVRCRLRTQRARRSAEVEPPTTKSAMVTAMSAANYREDELQAERCEEIIQLLVAAGYFRARIKGLSNFDKVVGGLVWCIQVSNFWYSSNVNDARKLQSRGIECKF